MAATIESRLSDSLRDISAFTDVKDIIAIQNQLRAFESDFDKAQSSLRTIASAWILAAIGAIGLVVQNELTGAHRLDGSVAASLRQALFLVASLGLASLWYLDQRVYQRLLHSVFSTGCHLELKTAKILPIRSRAYLLNRDVTSSLGLVLSRAACPAVGGRCSQHHSRHVRATGWHRCFIELPRPSTRTTS